MTAKRANLNDPLEKQNRERALAQAVEDHGERLLAFLGGKLRDRVEAEDLLQEVFAELIESYDLGSAIESLGAWLFRVARNKALDRFRRRKTESTHRAQVIHEADGPAETLDRPDEEWERGWLRVEIVEALELLPPEQLDVFVRHELEGQSFEDISAATGIGVNTLLSRKHAAVLFLREHLKEVYDELE